MMPSEKQLNEPGPVRDLWAHAAVRERFSAGELFSNWVADNAGADKETVRTARLAAVELQRASKSALGINGRPASTLDAGDRIGVLRVIR
ncbi:hypothetical protein M2323_004678 [Rhodoblastus acidophilus]|uniref:hypothetical protein n=1 Tax=Rhodoblastus acidophilus TaxID=1074 RepID=UPI00222518AA|nr:hypothetical protein [Rhodoblastus acidophilus]MCW2286861.1 hypothetical protein [Rhodoblastus acidophilus]MCW2335722.1 hypothetical protein [Rhodoblastus acidophilus]